MIKTILQKKNSNKNPQLRALIFAVLAVFAGSANVCFGQVISEPVYREITKPSLSGGNSECAIQKGDKVIEFQISPVVAKSDIKELSLIYFETGQKKVFSGNDIKRCGGGGLRAERWMIIPDAMPADLKMNEVVLKAKIQKPGKDLVSSSGFVTAFEPVELDTAVKRVEADGRDDAEVYVAGEIIAEKGEYPKQSADIKYERQFGARAIPFRFGPYFDLKASNSADADDYLKFGMKFTNSIFFDGDKNKDEDIESLRTENPKRFVELKNRRPNRQYFRWEANVGIESDKKFRVTNFMTTQKLKWLVRPKMFREEDDTPVGRLTFTPFIGLDLGANVKTPIARDERAIVRALAGGTLVLKIFTPFKNFPQVFKDFGVQTITWENSFEQRWFLVKEQAYDTDDDDNLILRDFGKRPRGYFTSTLQFKLNDFFAPTVAYEWGQQPPLYKMVEHRVKIGFTYSFKRDVD